MQQRVHVGQVVDGRLVTGAVHVGRRAARRVAGTDIGRSAAAAADQSAGLHHPIHFDAGESRWTDTLLYSAVRGNGFLHGSTRSHTTVRRPRPPATLVNTWKMRFRALVSLLLPHTAVAVQIYVARLKTDTKLHLSILFPGGGSLLREGRRSPRPVAGGSN